MEASVVLAIGAAGAYHRAGLPFALPPRWEDEYREWTEDNVVREALGVSSDREAERVLTRMLRDSGLRRAADLVFERRVAEVALGVRPDDSTLARLYRVVYDTARSALPSFVRRAFAKFERDYPRYARRAANRLGVSTASPSDVLAEIDADIDAEIARAGFGDERMTIGLDIEPNADSVNVGGPVEVGVGLDTLSAITGKAFDAAVKGLGKTANVVGDGVENAANAIADAIPDPRPQVNAALIIGGVAAFALLVIALRRQS